MKQFAYFQPEYVSKFKCDGSKCDARCCKGWTITIDAATYKKYSRIKPKSMAKEITSYMKFDSERGEYVVQLTQILKGSLWQNSSSAPNQNTSIASKEVTSHIDYNNIPISQIIKDLPCPFLTADRLCGIQLNYGEEFLSQTCVTYPRRTHAIGKFFERSMTLTCPVAAELILFNLEPMKFEFVEVPDKVHSKHGRIRITKKPVDKQNADFIREIQITMISLLQRRQFTLDERLILLGLFLDRLQECKAENQDTEILPDLIEIYRSEEFLSEEMLPWVQSFVFDASKFISFMLKFISYTLDILKREGGRRFLTAFEKTLSIKPDENEEISIPEVTANFKELVDARKDFLDKYSPFLENYLVNELFFDFYPWRFHEESFTKNFAVFLISYKIFELMTFATVQSGLDSKEDLLAMVDWFMTKTDHNPALYERFLELLEDVDNTYLLMVTLL